MSSDEVFDDVHAMLADMAKHVGETGKPVFSADSVTERAFRFSDGERAWKISHHRVRACYEKEPDEMQRKLLAQAFETPAGRKALAEAISKAPMKPQPKSRFNREDPI